MCDSPGRVRGKKGNLGTRGSHSTHIIPKGRQHLIWESIEVQGRVGDTIKKRVKGCETPRKVTLSNSAKRVARQWLRYELE